MANTNQAQTISAFKRLAGRANTSAAKAYYEENIPSALQTTTKTVFSDTVPQVANDISSSADFPSRYAIFTGSSGNHVMELVPFVVETIGGTLYDDDQLSDRGGEGSQNSGYHGYQLKLPADYESRSSNPAAGSGVFVNNQVVHESNGLLQLVGPTLAPNTRPKLNMSIWTSASDFSSSTAASYTGIPATDPIDWVPDYFNGTIFMQDYDASKIPTFAMGYVYIGKMADTAISDAAASGSGTSITAKDEGSNITTALASIDFVGSGVTATNSSNNITVTIPGGASFNRRRLTANATASAADSIIGISSSGNSDNIELRLANASTLSNGQYFTVKKEDNFTSTITISCSGSQKIDGQSSIVIESAFGAVNIYSDATSSYFVY